MTEQDAARSAQTLPAAGERGGGSPSRAWQTGVGGGIALVALALAWATWRLPAQQALADGGARLVPGVCASVLLLCGLWLVWEAHHGGWRNLPAGVEPAAVQITPWVWVMAGLLLSALLIRYSGFVVAAALCYVLAVQGLRQAAQPGLRLCGKRLGVDVLTGVAVAAVVYGLFARVLGIALPAGWLPWM